MSLSTKILVFLGTVITLGLLSFIIYKQIELSAQQQAIQTQMVDQKQLVDGVVRSSAQWTTKSDLDAFAKANNISIQAINDDLAKLHADITAINVTVADSLGQNNTNVPSTGNGPSNPNPPTPGKCQDGTACPNLDPWGYQLKMQLLSLNEEFEGGVNVPIGNIGFSAWQKFPFSYNILPRAYSVDTVIGTDENERIYTYDKFNVSVDGKSYEIPIKTSTTQQIYPEAKFSWFNPRLLLGADFGVNINQPAAEFIPSLSLGIMSYGQYKTSPTISVLEIGVGYGVNNKKPQAVVTPFAYNLGQFIPIIKNTYIAPSLSIGTDGQFTIAGGLRVAL